MKVKTLNYTIDGAEEQMQRVFCVVQEVINKFHGMLARFNVDDKGAVFFACLGPNPCAMPTLQFYPALLLPPLCAHLSTPHHLACHLVCHCTAFTTRMTLCEPCASR